jgi:RNA polymerase sigma-70 factor (ECF subfamily)
MNTHSPSPSGLAALDNAKNREDAATSMQATGTDEDRLLVEKTMGGDAQAFEELFIKYRQRVFGTAWRIVRDEDAALDVVQDAFVRAWQRMSDLRGETRFFPWLRRIAVNLAIDRLRQSKRGQEVSFDEAQFGAGAAAESGRAGKRGPEHQERESPNRKAELGEFTSALEGALEQLSDAHRTVFLLHAAEGMTYREIADAMEINMGTVMSRLFYARKRLQELLEPHLEGER